jgi:medium-chain acyl-[acyl-carrier-protein] hydrolase
MSAGPDPWMIYPRPNPAARLRLFCFPYAGGRASMFRHWPEALPPSVDVGLVQLPGRETRLGEPPFTRLEPLVRALAEALRPHLNRPFAFFGHSMGALVSFELARELRRASAPTPVQLLVSGCPAPQLGALGPLLHSLPEPDFKKELRRLGGTPRDVLGHAELMQLLLPLLRADFAAYETYTHQWEPLLDCPISALGGLDDQQVSPGRLHAWSEQTRRRFRLRMLPGDHFFLHAREPLVLAWITEELARLNEVF